MYVSLRRICWLAFAMAPAALAFPLTSGANDDLREQLAAVTKEIEKNPRNAQLYLRRGRLHRARSDFDAAQADFDYAGTLDTRLQIVDFLRGENYFDAKWFLSAKVVLDRFLS